MRMIVCFYRRLFFIGKQREFFAIETRKIFCAFAKDSGKNCKKDILIIEKIRKKKPSNFGGFCFGTILAIYNIR